MEKWKSIYGYVVSLSHRYITLIFLLISPSILLAQQSSEQDTIPRYFEGLYIGTNLSAQNILAATMINDAFVSQERTTMVIDIIFGHRWQFINDRVTFNLEVHAGILDTNLQSNLTTNPDASIQFTNNSQVGLGYDLGYVVDSKRRLLIYLYARQVRRTFQVTGTGQRGTTALGDVSIVSFRYGLGAAYHIAPNFNVQLSLGTFSNDLQNDFFRITHPEASIGIVYQF